MLPHFSAVAASQQPIPLTKRAGALKIFLDGSGHYVRVLRLDMLRLGPFFICYLNARSYGSSAAHRRWLEVAFSLLLTCGLEARSARRSHQPNQISASLWPGDFFQSHVSGPYKAASSLAQATQDPSETTWAHSDAENRRLSNQTRTFIGAAAVRITTSHRSRRPGEQSGYHCHARSMVHDIPPRRPGDTILRQDVKSCRTSRR